MEKGLHSFQGFKNKQNQQKLCSFDLKNLSSFEFTTPWLELAVSLHLVPPIHNNTKPCVCVCLLCSSCLRSTFQNLNPEALVFIGLPEQLWQEIKVRVAREKYT